MVVTSLAKKYNVQLQLKEPKKSGRKAISSNDEEKECIVSFIFVLHAFYKQRLYNKQTENDLLIR